ncbi:MAG TPA: DinB family protein [Acidimicrobiia bacterium]|nr:DinB family protein [Acidimicrobiia bacterium]
MTTTDLLKARLAIVRRDFDHVLDRLEDDFLPWTPADGLRTVGEHLFCVVGKEIELLDWMKKRGEGEWVEIEPTHVGGKEDSVEGWRIVLLDARNQTLGLLNSLSEVDLEAVVKFPGDWWEGLLLTELPMHECFRTIAFHEWYHTGQLDSYLALKGRPPKE